MTTAIAMSVTPTQTPSLRDCDACPYGRCEFSVKLVTLYLICHRQATLYREPFDLILASRVRSSRFTDPGISGNKRIDPMSARAIGWSLDALERQHGPAFLHPANAQAVARLLCSRSEEGQV